ncbi:MAG: hypothetical protein EDM77_00340 [Candidatus Jettenia sp. AMX1]|nr:MAG: hypothetical protein EDM77_00340 [Candidatus Jettenia sp. AMX1]MCE7879084.1 hypothetical protein [Candidatus Jettenia sp. AMX1]MCQ3925830.1 hypothetical protein [Candidatus Jettenia sp.]GIL20022.1 MAG: hypothetical protein BroJett041_11360 [Candidatus Jettenia caeni]GJQ45970.1 MAG: hypothetical protein JETCAE04_17240 [Candidatus Jettenia caeni]
MKPFKKFILIALLCLAYISIIYFTFNAVSRVYRTNNPIVAKRIVMLTFFVNVCIFAGSGYLVYKLKVPTEKK